MRFPFRLAPCVVGAALICGAMALGGCAQEPTNEETVNINGGAERSYSDEELKGPIETQFFPTAFSFEELMADHRCEPGQAEGDGFGRGGYIVGTEGAPAAGTYYLTGSQEKNSTFAVYTPAEEAGMFENGYIISYFGFTLVDVHDGDAIFFVPAAETDLITPLPAEPIPAEEPYQSGLYRVGVDIPMGTYTVTQSEASAEAIEELAQGRPEVIVYASLDFTEDNRVSGEELPLLSDGPVAVEVTVTDGQYLELYGCTATRLALP